MRSLDLLFLSLVLFFGALAFYLYRSNGNSIYQKNFETLDSAKIDQNEAITLGDVVMKANGPQITVSKDKDPEGKDKVIKHKSSEDGKMYYVAASLPEKERAANFLAEISRREQFLLQTLDEMLDGGKELKAPDGHVVTDNMKLLVKKHFRKETPFAEYHNPHDRTVGSNSAKGELVEICLRNKYNTNSWNSLNTAFRVHVHELAHSADTEYRADGDHGPTFNRLMNYLLEVAENIGIYNCKEYKASGRKFCGLILQENDDFCK